MARGSLLSLAGLLLSGLAPAALGHAGHGFAGGFESGFLHPLLGGDHVAAMVAVGLWGAFLGAPALWLLPVVFPLVMALGGAAGVLGLPLPGVELAIAGSSIVLGLLVALAARPPLWLCASIVGAFAIFHGHAHGTELPEAAAPAAYAGGFVVATGLLHVAGILLGLLAHWPAGRTAVRVGGGVICAGGVAFLLGF
jgi:urease accessory protein